MRGGIRVEGTVTISLKAFEELKKEAGKRDYYFDLAVGQVELLEKVFEYMTDLVDVDGEIIDEIVDALENWYG